MKRTRLLIIPLAALLLQGCCHMLGMTYLGVCRKPSGAERRAAEHCIAHGHAPRDADYVRCMAGFGHDVPADPSSEVECGGKPNLAAPPKAPGGAA